MTTPDPQTTQQQLTGVWVMPRGLGKRFEVLREGDRWLAYLYKHEQAVRPDPDGIWEFTEVEQVQQAIWRMELSGFVRNPYGKPVKPQPMQERKNWIDRLFDYRT